MKHLQAILHDKFNDDKDYYTIGMIEVLDELDHQVKIMERKTKNQMTLIHEVYYISYLSSNIAFKKTKILCMHIFFE